jgi:HAMP domain-containing protein
LSRPPKPLREVDELEAEFNRLIARLNERLGLTEDPRGFFRRLFK